MEKKEILSEFHEHGPNVKNFHFLEKKDPIFRKIRENFGNVPIIQKIIQNYSVVSLVVVSRCSQLFAAQIATVLRSVGLTPTETELRRMVPGRYLTPH